MADDDEVPADGEEEEQPATNPLLAAFLAWFEREGVSERIDRFVVENAHRMASTGSIEVSAEQSHEWWPLYLEYQQQFEVLLDEFVAEAGCTTDEFLAAAQEAEGINEFYVKIFLSHAEYSMFVEMMGQEALRQAAENDLSGES